MRLDVVLSFDVDEHDIEQAKGIVQAIDAPSLPYFAGVARVVIAEAAVELERWLDE